MNKKIFFRTIIMSIFLYVFTTNNFVSALSHENCKIIRGIEGTVSLEQGERMLFFKLNKEEIIKDTSYLDLDFMLETSDNKYDYIMQVNLNKNMVKEIDLENAKANRKNLKIDIPKEYFKPGYNKLVINLSPKDKNKRTSSKDICKIFGESYIHIEL